MKNRGEPKWHPLAVANEDPVETRFMWYATLRPPRPHLVYTP